MSEKIIVHGNELYHFGIKGQKWGERRYQYEDGSLTPEGRQHYGYGEAKAKMVDAKTRMQRAKAMAKDSERAYVNNVRLLNVTNKNKNYENARKQRMQSDMKEYYDSKKAFKQAKKEYKNSEEYKQAKKDTAKKVAIAGAAIVGTALAAYGTYKLSQLVKDKATSQAKIDGKKAVDTFMRNKAYGKSSLLGDAVSNINRLDLSKTSTANYGGFNRTNAQYQINSDGLKFVGDSAMKVYKDAYKNTYENMVKHPIKTLLNK